MFKERVTDIFFDLDHTLWDFEKNSALTFEKIFKEQQIDLDIDNFLKVYVPANLKYWKMYREEKITKAELRYQRLKFVFDEVGYQASDKTVDVLAEEYINQLSSFNHLFQDTIAVLDYLKPKYKLHIITNGFQNIQAKKLKGSGIHKYFDVVVDAEMAGVKKPNPIIFNLALNKAKVASTQALMIGDSLEADILGAKAVGMHTLHFNDHGEEVHEHAPIIYKLKEIKSFL